VIFVYIFLWKACQSVLLFHHTSHFHLLYTIAYPDSSVQSLVDSSLHIPYLPFHPAFFFFVAGRLHISPSPLPNHFPFSRWSTFPCLPFLFLSTPYPF